MPDSERRPAQILMVEDDEQDARLTLESLKRSKVRNDVTVVASGEEALRYLRREGAHADRARPDLVLLDINLPGMNGVETLREIKTDPALKTIPVVMLTTSDQDEDILSSYQEHAAAYLTKPITMGELGNVIAALERFWFEVVLLPPDVEP